jgi:hypothetical protein
MLQTVIIVVVVVLALPLFAFGWAMRAGETFPRSRFGRWMDKRTARLSRWLRDETKDSDAQG